MLSSKQLGLSFSDLNRSWVSALAFGFLWLLLLKELAVDWNIDPQYGYGWGVPPLLLYLFWKRWVDRPVASSAVSGASIVVLSCALLLSILPLRLIQEANPDWRLLSWLMAFAVVGLGFCALYYQGGWAWTTHFAVPAIFVLLSVPWPSGLEQNVTQSLMRVVTAATAEAMNWLGEGATAQGNVIQLSSGGVGVTEACSGIRSFQTSCMLAIFFGELYRLPVSRRLLVLALSLGTAIALNIVRAFMLTWICAQQGPAVESAWHDRVGTIVLAVTTIAVWLIARECWRLGAPTSPVEKPAVSSTHVGPRLFPIRFASLVLVWLVCAEGAVQGWYQWHELDRPVQEQSWSIRWPTVEKGFQVKQLPDETRKLLRCDLGETGQWTHPGGGEWTIFYFRWRPGRMAAQLAKGHTPDVCLPANGFRQVANLGPTTTRVHGTEIPFNTYIFEAGGRTYYVFFCQVDDRDDGGNSASGQEAATYLAGLEPIERLRAVREGRRHAGHQVLEIAMTGYADVAAAQRALAAELGHLVTLGVGR